MTAGVGTAIAVLGSGLLAGLLHVVSGVDHLAALLPLSVGRRLGAFATGVRWGLGHSAGVLVVGLFAVALKQRLDLERVGAWGESLVGVALLGIGILGIRSALRIRVHAHVHEHGPAGHVHLHAHFSPAHEHAHRHTAFATGTLHGVAGSAHLFAVLPAVALPGWLASGAYLAAFAIGTIAAMGGFAALVGEGTSRVAGSARALRGALLAAGVITMAVGVAWMWPAA